jgi:hypothetical protein
MSVRYSGLTEFFASVHRSVKTARPNITLPFCALVRARVAINTLEEGVPLLRDFIQCVRAAQRAMLELHAFKDWWIHVELEKDGKAFTVPPPPFSRRVLVSDLATYYDYYRADVPVYISVPKDMYDLNFSRRVHKTSRAERCILQHLDRWPLGLKHTMDLWYYPPFVRYPISEFKPAARGYLPHLDKLVPSPTCRSGPW